MHATFAFALLAAAAPAVMAQLSTFRATIPGSLHQCEQTNVFIFDTNNARPVTLVFFPSSTAPSSSTVTLADALQAGPLQVIEGITTPDAQQYNFQLAIAAGVSFETFGFLPDGSGKNLNLPRTVQTALPGAASCNPATVASAAAAAATGSSSSSSRSGRVALLSLSLSDGEGRRRQLTNLEIVNSSASAILVGAASSAQSSASRVVAAATESAGVSTGLATVTRSSTSASVSSSSSSAASGSSSASAVSDATTSGAAGKLVGGMGMAAAVLVGAITVMAM